MVGRDKLDCVPLFLGELAEDIFVCGKTINLLKLCCPEVQFLFVIVNMREGSEQAFMPFKQ